MTQHKHNTYLVKDDSGTEIATVYIRYTRSDGSGGWRVDTARKPTGGACPASVACPPRASSWALLKPTRPSR